MRRLALEQLESRRLLSISGDVLTDNIYPAGDRDEHFFTISSQELSAAGGEYVVTLSLSGGLSGFQPVARLQAPSGNLFGSEIDAGSSQTFKLTVAGNYVVKVQDNDDRDTGTYVLALEGIQPPSLDAQAITLGELKTARLDVMGEVDEYTFTATAGNIVTLSLSESHLGSRATLFSPAGDKVKLYSALTGNRVSQVAAGNKVLSEPLQAGKYVIQVYDNNYTDIGDYQLSLEGLVPASADAVALTPGETKTGDIVAGEVDAYKFTATGGNVVTVSLSDVVSGTSSSLWAELYSPSGNKVAKLAGTNGPDEVENGNKVVYRLPAETGTYVIQVYDYDYTHPEAYGVTLEGLNPRQPGRRRDRLRPAEDGNDQPAGRGRRVLLHRLRRRSGRGRRPVPGQVVVFVRDHGRLQASLPRVFAHRRNRGPGTRFRRHQSPDPDSSRDLRDPGLRQRLYAHPNGTHQPRQGPGVHRQLAGRPASLRPERHGQRSAVKRSRCRAGQFRRDRGVQRNDGPGHRAHAGVRQLRRHRRADAYAFQSVGQLVCVHGGQRYADHHVRRRRSRPERREHHDRRHGRQRSGGKSAAELQPRVRVQHRHAEPGGYLVHAARQRHAGGPEREPGHGLRRSRSRKAPARFSSSGRATVRPSRPSPLRARR